MSMLTFHSPLMKDKPISVVIICKDAVRTITKAIQSALLVSDDVVVVDSGSTDGTIEIITNTSAKLVEIDWQGYGYAKNKGNAIALHQWIVSLDADEWIDNTLAESILKADLGNSDTLFSMRRLNYLGSKPVYYGEWRNDIVIRMFNKQNALWDATAVHEELVIKRNGATIRLKGILHHYTSPGIAEYKLKLKKYAALMAEKNYNKGRKAYWYKIYLSPVVNFLQNYIVKAGFLNGKEGLEIALANASYTSQKYKILKALDHTG